MTISMYNASVPIFKQLLSALNAILAKAEVAASNPMLQRGKEVGCVQPVSPGGIINVLTDAYIPKAARMYHHL